MQINLYDPLNPSSHCYKYQCRNIQGGTRFSDSDFTSGVPELVVAPNPANETLYIHTRNIQGQQLLSLYDLSGMILVNRQLDDSNDALQLDVSRIPSGMYYLTLQHNTGTLIKKVAIIK